MDIQERIAADVKSNPVLLYMKGTADEPMCGFSARAAMLLNKCGVEFADINVLADPELREGVKVFSNWPTVPQLYVNGEFIGGCDIMMEMFEAGELQELLKPLAK
ncbi:MAG TPA: Grx4 family monothiol glutaredoxin [Alphaproteobacteria bacterium]|nr:Grx4 family monothiol glutaredoxin [Alphaproteobacteria bacterium]